MDLRLILFDLDGTLLDTLGDIADACNHALTQLGQPIHPNQAYRFMVGDGADVLVRRALPPDRQHLADEAHDLFKSYYTDHAVVTTAPYPGIPELLDGLAERRIPIAVVTNKPQRAAEIVVEQLLGRWAWSAIAGHHEGVPKKPDPTSALQIAQALDIPPARCGFLGDSNTDMRTAQAAGMVPLGAAWGFRGREELQAHGARLVMDHPVELLHHLT